ncbi:MAG: PLP-dependent aminotransferase family protein [Rubrivivax sp.]
MLLSDYLLQHLDRAEGTGAVPLNRQIYGVMREAILRGVWAADTRLPSSRELAADTQLSRNTVLHAYQQLLAEGYIVARAGSGSFVSDTLPASPAGASTRKAAAPRAADAARRAAGNPAALLSQRARLLLRDAALSGSPSGAFALGVSDTSAFPHATWARLIGRRWRYPSQELLNYAHGGGYGPLREALADHLRLARSVNGTAEQIVLTTGIQQSIALVATLFTDVGDRVWTEEPGYRGARNLLRACGLETVPIPVDDEGLAPRERDLAQPPRLAYVTPSHQFPLGMVMSLARRRLLLDCAHRQGMWILEDDYDSEFRFEGRSLASLQGLDEHDRVLYMGSFSKTLFPGIRVGYLVLPGALAERCAAGYAELYRDGQLVQQAALADFMAGGHYATHIRRTRRLYAAKQSVLREAIVRRFGDALPISTHEAGLHLVLHLPDACDDALLCEQAAAQGVVVRPLSRHFLQRQGARQGLLLGYAGVAERQIRPAFDKLALLIEKMLR